MKRFIQFIKEDYDKTCETLTEAPAPVGAQLFHKDIGIPAHVAGPRAGLRLNYSSHAKRAALDDGITRAPAVLPATVTVIEVEVVAGRVTKWVVRFPDANAPGKDLVMAVQPDGLVRTVWHNSSTDTHKTLKRWLYTQPNGQPVASSPVHPAKQPAPKQVSGKRAALLRL